MLVGCGEMLVAERRQVPRTVRACVVDVTRA
jgi:hypothetical protein